MVSSAAFTTSAFSSAVCRGFKSPSLRPSGLGSSPIPVHKASRHVEVPLVHATSSRFSSKPNTERRRFAPSLPALSARKGSKHKDSRHVEVPLVPTASSSVPAKSSTEKRRKTSSSSVLTAKKAQGSSSDGSGEFRSYATLKLGRTSSQSCIKGEMPLKLWNGTAHERDFARHFVRSLTKDKAKAEKFIRKHLSEPSPPPASSESRPPPASADARPHGGDSSIVPNVVLPDVPDRSFSDCSGWESPSTAGIAEFEEAVLLPDVPDRSFSHCSGWEPSSMARSNRVQSFRQQQVAAQVPALTPSASCWSWKSISCLAATAVTVGIAIGVTACNWFS